MASPSPITTPIIEQRIADHVLLLQRAGLKPLLLVGSRQPRRLISRCVDTGPDGDAKSSDDTGRPRSRLSKTQHPKFRKAQLNLISKRWTSQPKKNPLVHCDVHGGQERLYINGEKFTPDAAPMVRAKVGAYQHWKIVMPQGNCIHAHPSGPFPGVRRKRPADRRPTLAGYVNVAYGGSVDVIMDFTDPVIKGMSVFHCHLLNHEDKGMMAKILFE